MFTLHRPASVDTADDATFEQWRTRLHELLEYALTQATAASGSSNSSVRAPAGSSAASVSSRLAELFPKYLKLEKPSNDSYNRSSSTSSQGIGTASSYSQAVFTVSIKYRVMFWRRLRVCEIFLSIHVFPQSVGSYDQSFYPKLIIQMCNIWIHKLTHRQEAMVPFNCWTRKIFNHPRQTTQLEHSLRVYSHATNCVIIDSGFVYSRLYCHIALHYREVTIHIQMKQTPEYRYQFGQPVLIPYNV